MHSEYWEDVTDATVRKIGMFVTSRGIKLIAASLQAFKKVLPSNKCPKYNNIRVKSRNQNVY